MRRRLEFWELAACAAAAGGTSVWGLAAAARVGWLRALLDLIPRSGWDALTWALIPALLLLPLVAQGAVTAALAMVRPIPVRRGIVGSVGGTLLLMLAAGMMVLAVARHQPGPMVGALVRTLPQPAILAGGGLLAGGWLVAAGRSLGSLWLRRGALPLAVLGTGVAWLRARGWLLAAANVLDRAETVVFFTAVVVGGTLGSVWMIRRGAADLTGPKVGRYNVRNLSGSGSNEAGEEPFPSMVRK